MLWLALRTQQRRSTRGEGVLGGVPGELGPEPASRSHSGSRGKRPSGGACRLSGQLMKCSGGRSGTGGGVSGTGSRGGGGGGLCRGCSRGEV